jgi:hypothetical protein
MSGIDIDRFLVETATRVETTYNEFGDVDYGSTSSEACLYRDISDFKQVPNRYEVGIDGILWLAASSSVARGDTYYHPDEGYLQIVKITKAKTFLTDNTHKFMRCLVSKQRQVS